MKLRRRRSEDRHQSYTLLYYYRPHEIHLMRSLNPLLQLPFPPFTRSLGGWMQGEGRSPPPTSSVHFAWKWAKRNSTTVHVCISVSPSPSAGLSSLGPPILRKLLVCPEPVTQFLLSKGPLLPICLLTRITTTPITPVPSLSVYAWCAPVS
jgi:hypothetical protein